MNDHSKTPETVSAFQPRARRGEEALVAQYIHELSARHGRADEPNAQIDSTEADAP